MSGVSQHLERSLVTRAAPPGPSCDTSGTQYDYNDANNCINYLFAAWNQHQAQCVITGGSTTFVTCNSAKIVGTTSANGGKDQQDW